MTALLALLWPALALAAVLGAGFAAVFGPGAGLPSARIEVRVGAALALLAASGVAAFGAVPGRPGLWLDIGVLCALAYAAGVALGTAVRWLVRRRMRTPAPAASAQGAADAA